MLTKRDFEEWLEAQDVEYTLLATVDGEVIAKSTSHDIYDVVSESEAIQNEVDTFLAGEYNQVPDEDTL